MEDEAPIAEVVAAYAEREGYDILWAVDGEAAMALWEKQGASGQCSPGKPSNRRRQHGTCVHRDRKSVV